MKILIISRNAWDDTNSIGNTFTNFFKGIEGLEFANIYFRSSNPNNNLCKYYYRVTEGEVLRKWFSSRKIGRKFVWGNKEKTQNQSTAEKNERELIRFIHKYNFKVAYKFSDYIWYSEKWLNKNLKDFIESFAPDVMVTFVKSAPQYYLTVKFLRENYNIPLFSWIADDEYTTLLKKHSLKEIDNLKYILKESSVVRGCSEEICEYYNSVFNCEAIPLYKGCDLSTPVKDYINQPIKMVYAGNLLYGRLEIIHRIVDALEIYASGEQKIVFEIYSNTLLSPTEQSYFDQKSCSKYMGKQDYEIITQRLADADIVLHVESFETEQILKTRFSFSTKIIDCLQSGNVLLAVGPREVASIDYVKKIPGACVIDNLELLDVQLGELLDDTKALRKRMERIREFARLNHDISKNSEEMKNILKKIMGGE